MGRSDIISVIDIGSTKICCCIASVLKGEINILGIGYCACTGIVSGVIVEMESVCKSVSNAIDLAEAQAKRRLECVYVSISGKNITAKIEKYKQHIGGRLVDAEDIVHMLKKHAYSDDSKMVVLHKLPVTFSIDNLHGIKSPIGMIADNLEARVAVIEAPKTQVNNLLVCLSKCHVEAEGIVAAPYASGLSFMNDGDEYDQITVLDLGGGATSISFFYNGEFCGLRTVPFGGGHITNELSKNLGISYADAERLKVLYGSAIPSVYDEDDSVLAAVPDDNNTIRMQQISKNAINQIIQPCIEQLIAEINDQLKNSPFTEFGKNIILTGGASQFPGLADSIALTLNKNVVLRNFTGVLPFRYGELTPGYSTSIGLLKYAQQINREEISDHRYNQFDFESIVQKIIAFFKTK